MNTPNPIQASAKHSLKQAKLRVTCLLPALALILGLASASPANAIDLAKSPLLTLKTAPGLVMLTMGRDLPLYKAAFNDVNDIDGDGIPDIFFKPAFKYEGYFAYDRCYTYASSVFTPDSIGTPVVVDSSDLSKNYYKCPGKWSGNFLNWVSMARIDVIRKVLYGGNRSTDTASTVLERTYVPQDSTLWGKEYLSVANDGYNISDYTPLALPTGTNRHMFANTSLASSLLTGAPYMIVYKNRSGRIWTLVAAENLILGANPGADATATAPTVDVSRYTVRVQTCIAINGKYEDWCSAYTSGSTTRYKPTGLLHKYGEAKTLAFGLISGTYDNNYAGGVLRQNIDNFGQEVDQTNGQFTTVKGIVYHLSRFKPLGFGANGQWNCGSFTSLPPNASCPAWGNPLGEMMFEGLQYFAAGKPTPAFAKTETIANTTNNLALQQPTWINPYAASTSRSNTAAYPKCARPIQMTIGDPKTSFDSDHLPGAAFSVGTTPNMGTNSTPTLGSLNVSTEADAIWSSEFSNATKKFFIGEVPGDADGNPSAKTASSFRNIRGHGPDATTNQGSFYGASVARYGKYTGVVNPAVGSTALRVDQISIALDSHVPQIKIPLPNGNVVSLVLLSKSVNLYGISNAKGAYQQTGAITAFFIDKMANTNTSNTDATINGGRPYYNFRISFSDADQGNDNESDAKVTYEIKVTSANTLTVGVDYFEGSNGIEMHQGYVISGTTNDGVYLDVGGAGGFRGPTYGNAMLPPAVGYYLDTMPGQLPGSAMNAPATGPSYTNIATRLPNTTLAAPRAFSGGASASGEFVPHDMLWYAAKYGSVAQNASGAFTGFNLNPDGSPKNYYFANNPSKLASQIGAAFQNAAALSNATATAAVSSGVKVSSGGLIYQAAFDTTNWGGDLRAYAVNPDGSIKNTATWVLSQTQPAPTARNVVLGLATAASPTAKTPSINASSYSTLGATGAAFIDENTFKYLLGDRTNEVGGTGSGLLRKRTSAVGDIINSDPLYIGQFNFGYSGTDYATFRAASNPNLIGIGSNDGFYRLIAADTGAEKLAFIPQTMASSMYKLADTAYSHQYYVDGPSAFGHLKFSDNKWRAVVASSLGAGGKAVFAFNASSTTLGTSSSGVLWEFAGSTAGDGAVLGNVLNKPIIAHLNNAVNETAVMVGNGTNSYLNKASLVVINAETGVLLRACTPTDAANTTGNGMTSIIQVSYAEDGKVDLIYAGDYKGNIWRINPKVNTCGADAVKVFTAIRSGTVQAITAEMSVVKAPNSKSGYMVLFGTGRYSTIDDPSDKSVQSLYGVWDENVTSPVPGTVNATRTDLVGYSFGSYVASNNSRGSTAQGDTSVNGGKTWLETTGKKGWMIDLSCVGCATGERFLDKPLVNGAISWFLSYLPSDDVCQPSGNGWITALDTNTGVFAKGYADSSTSNSAFVPGAAPRGLFIVTTTGSGSTPSKELLNISINTTDGNTADNPNPGSSQTPGGLFDPAGGKNCVGLDCTGVSKGNITQPPFTSRQVWRQIQ